MKGLPHILWTNEQHAATCSVESMISDQGNALMQLFSAVWSLKAGGDMRSVVLPSHLMHARLLTSVRRKQVSDPHNTPQQKSVNEHGNFSNTNCASLFYSVDRQMGEIMTITFACFICSGFPSPSYIFGFYSKYL